MTTAVPPVTFTLDPDGIGWIVFDAPGSKANVFDAATQVALGAALDAAEASTAKALVIAGAKERIFIAGADLQWLQALPDSATAEAFSRDGQALFQRVAEARMPVVCAIHGACAGGGLELALACQWRIASSAAATRIGLPEVGIGTIPGWGGCVRLPRLIGSKLAIEHILRAQLIGANDAMVQGLIDEVVPESDLRARAKSAAVQLVSVHPARRPDPGHIAPEDFEALRRSTAARTRGQPAPLAAIDAIQRSWSLPMAEALRVEARAFGQVTAGEICKNLIHVFFVRERAKRRTLDGWFEPALSVAPGTAVHKVGVVGAGVMGSGIAHWLASRGFDVVLRDVQVEYVERALGIIRTLLDESVTRGRMPAEEARFVVGRISTTTTWEGFSDCDLVIEAIVEDVAAKRTLFSELAAVVRPDALLASNTSALPVEEIAGHISGPERTLGIHFFNPVSRMPLVELIIGPRTSAESARRGLEVVRTLGKSAVICRSSPGFLVTRVLFFYLNAAVRLWEEGASTATVDAAMREFGWPMGPLRLIDEVGIDVTAFIFREMAHYFPGRFTATTACDRLLASGLKGRKNGSSRGFYRYAGATESVNDTEVRALVSGSVAPGKQNIVNELMQIMVHEARQCLAEHVVRSPEEVDFALLSGAGFPAFRGGLLHWAAGDAVRRKE